MLSMSLYQNRRVNRTDLSNVKKNILKKNEKPTGLTPNLIGIGGERWNTRLKVFHLVIVS